MALIYIASALVARRVHGGLWSGSASPWWRTALQAIGTYGYPASLLALLGVWPESLALGLSMSMLGGWLLSTGHGSIVATGLRGAPMDDLPEEVEKLLAVLTREPPREVRRNWRRSMLALGMVRAAPYLIAACWLPPMAFAGVAVVALAPWLALELARSARSANVDRAWVAWEWLDAAIAAVGVAALV
jgi:hypothetical protein